jgi:hypothetical protein
MKLAADRMARDKLSMPLPDVLEALGNEIAETQRRAAEKAATGAPGVLQVKECSVQLGVTWQIGGNGKVDFKVLQLGGSVDKANTETITVTLLPV